MDLVDLRDVPAALALGPREHVAVVGGGGKTTLVHALGHGLTGSRILTTTTKMGFDQHGGLPVVLLDHEPADAAVEAARAHGVIMAWASIDHPIAVGVAPATCDEWFVEVDHVVVEADGARKRPFKAPAHYEPVVPSSATVVLSTIGADALGEPIGRACHRPELVAALAGCEVSDDLSPARAAQVLVHDLGNRRTVPPGGRLIVVTTNVETRRRALVEQLERALIEADPGVQHVTVARTPY